MKFEGNIETSFAKAIASDNADVGFQALTMASNATANGSEIDFKKIIQESEISEKLEELLLIFPLDYANFDFYQGGEKSCSHLYKVHIVSRKSTDEFEAFDIGKRKSILGDVDGYMENIKGVSGNLQARTELNISKTEHEMNKKMLEADDFNVFIAISLHSRSALLDRLSPEYVRDYLTNNDIKAIAHCLDRSIDADFVESKLTDLIRVFVNTAQTSIKKVEELFPTTIARANLVAEGEKVDLIIKQIMESNGPDKKVAHKLYGVKPVEVEDDSAFSSITSLPLSKSLLDRLEASERKELTPEEREYYTELLTSKAISADDKLYVKELLDFDVSDEELKAMDEYDRLYEEEIEGKKKRKFGVK